MADARSVISEISITDQLGGNTNIFDDTDELELQQRVKYLEREITELRFENSLFETFLERKKAEPVVPPTSTSQSTTPNGTGPEVTSTTATSRAERLARKRSRSRSTQSDFRVQLTIEQKLDLITSEYEQTKNEELRDKTAHEKGTDNFESDREWIDGEITDSELSIAELLKLRDNSIDKRTKKLIGEKLARYFNDRLKGRESLINKFRDRSLGLKGQLQRVDKQLRQSEEMGDALTEIDFKQLKIENQQFLDKIDEKNHELVSLKQQVAQFTKLFNHYKDQLQMRTQDLVDIQKRIDKQQVLLEYTEREMSAANHEQTRAEKKNSDIVKQTQGLYVPEIIDYVRKKALLYKLQRDCEVWQRKLDIVTMGFQQSKQKWKAIQRNARYSNDMADY